MSKELTPLEALKNIEKEIEDYEGFDENTYYQMDRTRFVIIEKALKREDSIEITAIDIEQDNKELCKENKKLKRVLDIIKEKKVDVWALCISNCLESYNNYAKKGFVDRTLTQEEYDLLKEVLL